MTATTIIINGSNIQCGFSDDEYPWDMFPCTVRRLPNMVPMMGNRRHVVGDYSRRAKHLKRRPYNGGHVTDWDDMRVVWEHALDTCKTRDTTAVLMSGEGQQRARMAEVMFELSPDVEKVCVVPKSVLAMIASGAHSGVLLHSGERTTTADCIWEGQLLPTHRQISSVAGDSVVDELQELLAKRGHTEYSLDVDYSTLGCAREHWDFSSIAEEMKHKACYVPLDFDSEDVQSFDWEYPSHMGPTLERERCAATEILWNPGLSIVKQGDQRGDKGIQHLLSDCMQSFLSHSPTNQQLTDRLYSSIVLQGGNTRLNGFPQRLQKELQDLTTPDGATVPLPKAPEPRPCLPFAGASLLVEAGAVVWLTKVEFEEWGTSGLGIIF
eukprot:TRINITY_DN20639_c0_g1_i1.p1 TRINITY_DN20639_c0_g1~~TRINITY_DN20639_c0_g1_i1.p1  ORF type:complete len:381 (+),score=25.65 TRINITY_DN20639_c0_g1_i1:46-1188(+)